MYKDWKSTASFSTGWQPLSGAAAVPHPTCTQAEHPAQSCASKSCSFYETRNMTVFLTGSQNQALKILRNPDTVFDLFLKLNFE